MSALREAAQKALEALEVARPLMQPVNFRDWGGPRAAAYEQHGRAITALRAALAQQEQERMLEHAYKSACDIVEEQDKKLAELEAVNRELLEALVSFTKSGYIKKQHPKRYAAAVAAIAKIEGEQK